jgi:hypothetical protein
MKHGVNVLHALRMAITGQPWTPSSGRARTLRTLNHREDNAPTPATHGPLDAGRNPPPQRSSNPTSPPAAPAQVHDHLGVNVYSLSSAVLIDEIASC